MFEKLLQSLLNRLLGQYFQGFDSSNLSLGLWSGQVNIQNIRLKKDLLILLGFPITVKYSYVRNLRLRIPWKSLTSSATEVQLDGIYAVLGYIPEKQWIIKDKRIVQRRKNQLEAFRAEVLRKYSERSQRLQGNQQTGDSFSTKLILKIIDNLQVKVADIHLRFEDAEEEEYAFGMTLQGVRIATVNKNGVEEYIDRSRQEFREEPLRKTLEVKNLGVYWSRKAQMTYPEQLTEAQIQERLQNMINKNQKLCPYIILINFKAKLLQFQQQNFSAPETTVQIDMQSVRLQLQNKQLQQMITLSEKLQLFRFRVRQASRQPIPQQLKSKLLNRYNELYHKNYHLDFKNFPKQQLEQLQSILQKIPTEELLRTMKKQIVEREKQRLIQEKGQKKFWMFTYGKKELTDREVEDIEMFLEKNFNQEFKPVKRPTDYWFVVVELKLRRTEVIIGTKESHLSEGLGVTMLNSVTQFKLREGGYRLQTSISDLKAHLFSTDLTNSTTQRSTIFSKSQKLKQSKYLQLQIQSNPLGRNNIGTQIQLKIRTSMLIFNPVLVQRINQFSKIRVNESNKQAALQKFGQLKLRTGKSVSEGYRKARKLTDLSVQVSAPLIVVPFVPNSTGHCWGVNMGLLEIQSDLDLLESGETAKEAFKMKLEHMNFGWFQTLEGCQKYYEHGVVCRQMQNIIEDLALSFNIKKSNENIPETPKLSLHGVLQNIQLKMSQFSYAKLREIHKAFIPPQIPKPTGSNVLPLYYIRTISEDQKNLILKNREKIGILYKRNNVSKLWQKYTGVVSGNYLYLYGPDNKNNYEEYIYVKNSVVKEVPEDECGRLNTFSVSNKVNTNILLSFDKPAQAMQWAKLILSKKTTMDQPQLDLRKAILQQQWQDTIDITHQLPDQAANNQTDPTVNYDQINLQIGFELKQLSLVVYQTQPESHWLKVVLKDFSAVVDVHEARFSLCVLLGSLDIYDNVESYANPELGFFLKTIRTKDSCLITIRLTQIESKDPLYKNIDNDIHITFGMQLGNFKPSTIKKLFRFLLPSNQLPPTAQQLVNLLVVQMLDLGGVDSDFNDVSTAVTKPTRRQFLFMVIQVQQINLTLVNKNNRVKMYQFLFKKLYFRMVKSNEDTDIQVNAGNLIVSDCSGYPNTILTEGEFREVRNTFLKSLVENENGENRNRNMVEVNVRILHHVDPGEKDLFVRVLLNRIYLEFVLQPFMRVIDYIIYQLIPSINGSPQSVQHQKQLLQQQKLKQPQPIKHPQYSTWSLCVQAHDSLIRLPPAFYEHQQLIDLHVRRIEVTKDNFHRPYVTIPQATVLVTSYVIRIEQTYFCVRGEQMTNGLDAEIVIDSVEEPRYYKEQYGEKFRDGLRIYLKFGSFLMRLTNGYLNTIRKCVNWNIGYDDNCGVVLMPQANQEKKKQSNPMYLDIRADMVTLITTQPTFLPIAYLSIHKLAVSVCDHPTTGLSVEVKITDTTGSYFLPTPQHKIRQRGFLKQLGTRKIYQLTDLDDIPELVRLFYVRDSAMLREGTEGQILLRLTKSLQSGVLIQVKCQEFKMNVELKPLLQLTRVGNGDDSLLPPPPRLEAPAKGKKRVQEGDKGNEMVEMRVFVNNTVLCARNHSTEDQIGIQGNFTIHLTTHPSKPKSTVESLLKTSATASIPHTTLTVTATHTNLYLSQTDSNNTTKKRTLLTPLDLTLSLSQSYSIIQSKLTLSDELQCKTELVGLKVTVKDLLSLKTIAQQADETMREFGDGKNQGQREREKREQERELKEHRIKEAIRNKLQRKLTKKMTRKFSKLPIPKPSSSQQQQQHDQQQPQPQNPDLPIRSHTASIQFKQLQIVLINDSGSMFVPVLQLLLYQSNPILKSTTTQISVGTVLTSEINFFNPRSARWEPILERCRLTIGYIINKGGSESSEVSVSADEDELNINISSQMLRSLQESFVLARLEFEGDVPRVFPTDSEEELEISPYVFENMTNTTIEIFLKDDPRKTIAPSNLSLPTSNNPSSPHLPLRSKSLPPRFKGSVYIPVQTNQISIKLNNLTYAANINMFGKRRLCDSAFFIQCKVQKLNRLVKITGEATLVNITNSVIYLKGLDGRVEEVKEGMQVPMENVERVQVGPEEERLSGFVRLKEVIQGQVLESFNGHWNYTVAVREREISGLLSRKYYVGAPMRVFNCLPKPILVQMYPEEAKGAVSAKPIKSQSEYEYYRYGRPKTLEVKVSVPGYMWSMPISIEKNLNKQVDIVLKDRLQTPAVIQASIVQQSLTGCLRLTFFAHAYLINDTPYDLFVYSLPKKASKQTCYRVAGQISPVQHCQPIDPTLVILGSQVGTLLRFAQKATPDQLSSVVRIDQLGYHDIQIQARQNINGRFIPTYLTLGVDIDMKQMHKNSDVLSKEVRVTCRHIFYNKTQQKIYYRQVNSEEWFSLQGEQRRVAFLLDRSPENRRIVFKTEESEESAPILMRELGTKHFYVLEKVAGGGGKVYMRLSIRVTETNFLFIVLERLSETQAPFQIYNKVKKMMIKIPQLSEELGYKQRANFSYKNPDQSHIITAKLFHEQSSMMQSIDINPDKVNSRQTITLNLNQGKQLKLQLINQISKDQDIRIITLRKLPLQPQPDHLLHLSRLHLRRIGISFILNHDTIPHPYQFIYGYLENLEFVFQSTTYHHTFQLKLHFMQLDQNYPNQLMTPVIFTPEKYQLAQQQTDYSLVNILVRVDKRATRHMIITELTVEINDVTVRISEHFIKVLRDIARGTTKDQRDFIIKRNREMWLTMELPQQDGMMYIQQMKIFPFNVQLTCHIKPRELQERKGYVVQQVFIQAFGVAFTNVQQALITMKGITLQNSHQTPQGLLNKIIVHYRRNFFTQVYKVIGSLNIIGNPMGLFNNITTGLTDLIQKPVQGAVQGPIELGRGLAAGTHSLISHTIGGALHSLSQITNSISNTLTILCFDRRFQEMRDKDRMNPPKGVVDGIGKGVRAIYVGVREGVEGQRIFVIQGYSAAGEGGQEGWGHWGAVRGGFGDIRGGDQTGHWTAGCSGQDQRWAALPRPGLLRPCQHPTHPDPTRLLRRQLRHQNLQQPRLPNVPSPQLAGPKIHQQPLHLKLRPLGLKASPHRPLILSHHAQPQRPVSVMGRRLQRD